MKFLIIIAGIFVILMAFAFSFVASSITGTVLDSNIFSGVLWLAGFGLTIWGFIAK